jgi:peptidoglycan/xylan/chitin deacetylase (PgdA/CDA1 family)
MRKRDAAMRSGGIMFHHFHGAGHGPSQGSIDAETLEALIEKLGPRNVFKARTWLDQALAGTLPEGAVCLTFDDALRCQWDVAKPVLDHYDLTGFWFVYSSVMQGNIEPLEVYRTFRSQYFDSVDAFYDAFFNAIANGPYTAEVDAALADFEPARYLADFPFYTRADRTFRYVRDRVLGSERYDAVMQAMIARAGLTMAGLAEGLWLDDSHLRQLHEAGHVVGLHSHSHPLRVGELPFEAQRDEYTRNFEHLRRTLGEAPVAMSHPCNSYDPRTLQVLNELGIQLGFRANMADIGETNLEWPREDHANLLRAMSVEATV